MSPRGRRVFFRFSRPRLRSSKKYPAIAPRRYDGGLRDRGGRERRGADAQGVPLHRRGPAVSPRRGHPGHPGRPLGQVAGRHPLLLGRGLRRLGAQGEVQRQRRTGGDGGKADTLRPQRRGPGGHDRGRHTLLRRDPPGHRRAGPRVHGGGEGRPCRRPEGDPPGLLLLRVPSGLPGLQRLRVEDVRPHGPSPGMRVRGEGRRQGLGAGGQEGRVPEEALGRHLPQGQTRRAAGRVPATDATESDKNDDTMDSPCF